MKKIVLFYFSIFIFGCNVEPKNQESQSFFGEFLYYNDAAVLNTGQKIYGVVIDDDMFELYSYIPINSSNVIAVLVFPNFTKCHSSTLECTMILTSKYVIGKFTSFYFDFSNFFKKLFGVHN